MQTRVADVKAEDARVTALTRIFALENWGEWHFLPYIGIILLLWILSMGDPFPQSHRYTYCGYCFLY